MMNAGICVMQLSMVVGGIMLTYHPSLMSETFMDYILSLELMDKKFQHISKYRE
jgi:hypothetical protein